MTTTIKHTEVADFDDQGTTISVTATSDIDETEHTNFKKDNNNA